VEHSFTGPPYTIGVEEELMIVDAETLDLSNSIESLLKGIPQDLVGEVKPELLESVCEIATTPCHNTRD
jgi:carboxylate-amine ligase